METSVGIQISDIRIDSYLESLVDKFFKILPMREENEESLAEYISGFQRELLSFGELIDAAGDDGAFVSVVLSLQTLADYVNDENTPIKCIKKEVFNGINLCNRLRRKWLDGCVKNGGAVE